MYFIYIIHSHKSDIYYIGYSTDPNRRLEEHNSSPFPTFTSKHRPWSLVAVFSAGDSRGIAMKLEKEMKKIKNVTILKSIIYDNIPLYGSLAQLVRVPLLRD